MFAAFALAPDDGGGSAAAPSPPPAQPAAVPPDVPPPPGPPPPAPPGPPPFASLRLQQPPDPDRDAWVAPIYARLAASLLLPLALDERQPCVPVILHPSAPRGGEPPQVTARHLGFLRVDLTGEIPGPGRFFPLFPADASEEEAGVDTNSLDRFGCTGHWASSGCIRLLAIAAPAPPPRGDGDGGGDGATSSGGLTLMPQDTFAALWMRSSRGSGASTGASHAAGSGAGSGGSGAAAAAAAAVPGLPSGYHVPYLRLYPLVEAYGGLYRELKAAGIDLSRAHYMLRGWKTREGRPRLGASAPRPASAAAGGKKQRKGVVPADVATTRDLRALINWPGLLELLEEEGVESVPTDGVRYWLARLGSGFQAQLAAAGVLCGETSVHHIIARSSRGVDHPLNYFLIDRGPNSAMGSRVEGFRDANGVKLHMRDIVGERAFEVAHAACNLYHGVLYAGRRRGTPLQETLRELREGALAAAEEAMGARRAQEARQAARRANAAAAEGATQASQEQPASQEAALQASQEAAAWASQQPADQQQLGSAQQQEQQQQQQQQQQAGSPQPLADQPRSTLKRNRGSAQKEQQAAARENASDNRMLLSPSQQQGRRRRLSLDLRRAAPGSEPGAAAAFQEASMAVSGDGCSKEEEAEVEAEMAAMSLVASPAGNPSTADGKQQPQQAEEVGQQEQGQQLAEPVQRGAVNFGSLRARLHAALGITGA